MGDEGANKSKTGVMSSLVGRRQPTIAVPLNQSKIYFHTILRIWDTRPDQRLPPTSDP